MATSVLLRSAACSLALTACGDDGDKPSETPLDGGTDAAQDASPATRSVSINFAAQVGSQPFSCEQTYQQLGSTQVPGTFSDFRLYLHDVRLIDSDGDEQPVTLAQDGTWQYEGSVLLDFENNAGNCSKGDADTNDKIVGEVANREYDGIVFKVGLPSALNHSDPAATPSPLDIQALSWPWTQGRVFVTIDLRSAPVGDEAGKSFPIHVGSAGCTGNPVAGETVTCKHPNVAEIKLTGFDPSSSKIVIDPAALLTDLAIDGTGTGCMSTVGDAECDAIFPKLGLDPTTGASSNAPQLLFRIE